MVNVFSGGLIYEFTQEPNNYGLVEILPNNDVKLLADYHQLKFQFDTLPELDYRHIIKGMKENYMSIQQKLKSQDHTLPQCTGSYKNLNVSGELPSPVANDFLMFGVNSERGKYVDNIDQYLQSSHQVFDVDGDSPFIEVPTVEVHEDTTSSWSSNRRGLANCTYLDIFDDTIDYDTQGESDQELAPSQGASNNVVSVLWHGISKLLAVFRKAVP